MNTRNTRILAHTLPPTNLRLSHHRISHRILDLGSSPCLPVVCNVVFTCVWAFASWVFFGKYVNLGRTLFCIYVVLPWAMWCIYGQIPNVCDNDCHEYSDSLGDTATQGKIHRIIPMNPSLRNVFPCRSFQCNADVDGLPERGDSHSFQMRH